MWMDRKTVETDRVFLSWMALESFSRVNSPVSWFITSTHSFWTGRLFPLNTVCEVPELWNKEHKALSLVRLKHCVRGIRTLKQWTQSIESCSLKHGVWGTRTLKQIELQWGQCWQASWKCRAFVSTHLLTHKHEKISVDQWILERNLSELNTFSFTQSVNGKWESFYQKELYFLMPIVLMFYLVLSVLWTSGFLCWWVHFRSYSSTLILNP